MKPKRACDGSQKMSKRSLLALLPSRPDPTYILEVSTGKTIRIDSINTKAKPFDLKNGLYSKKYMPIETSLPRKKLLESKNWEIKSFNPNTKEVCISFKEIHHGKLNISNISITVRSPLNFI